MMTHYNWHEIEDKISLQGRTWIHENKLHYNWSCSGFTVKFKGTVLFAELEAAGPVKNMMELLVIQMCRIERYGHGFQYSWTEVKSLHEPLR